MTAKTSIFSAIAPTAIALPIQSVPISPVNMRAGYLLYGKKPTSAPSSAANIISPAMLLVGDSITPPTIIRQKVTIAPHPVSIPLNPAKVFTALAPAVTAKGIRGIHTSPSQMVPTKGTNRYGSLPAAKISGMPAR